MKNITFTIKVSWWFKYLYSPMFIAITDFIVDYIDIDFEPNMEGYIKLYNKAAKFKISKL